MDAVKVLPECLLVLEIVLMWVAAIKPDPKAAEPHKGMDCVDVTVGRFFVFVGEIPPVALCQAIIVLRRGASFHPLEVLMVREQVKGDVPPLNKTGETPSISLGNRKLS